MARHRIRIPPPMFSYNRHGEKFIALTYDPDPSLKLYVYIWNCVEQRRITPAVYIGPVRDREVFEFLKKKYLGGTYNYMVRRGRTIVLSELEAIGVSLAEREAFEKIRLKYGWERHY